MVVFFPWPQVCGSGQSSVPSSGAMATGWEQHRVSLEGAVCYPSVSPPSLRADTNHKYAHSCWENRVVFPFPLPPKHPSRHGQGQRCCRVVRLPAGTGCHPTRGFACISGEIVRHGSEQPNKRSLEPGVCCAFSQQPCLEAQKHPWAGAAAPLPAC